MQALAAAGWLHVWEDASRIGGRPRYALPTARALALAHEALLASSAGTPTERIAALLYRARPRRPLVLAPRVTPAFLAHQRECNDLLIAYAGIPGAKLLWSTSLDRPLPLAASSISLPQSDYLLVLNSAASPRSSSGSTTAGMNGWRTFAARRQNATPPLPHGPRSYNSCSASRGSWCG